MRTLLALWPVPILGFAARLPAPRERSFSFEYAVTEIATGAEDNHILHIRVTDPKEPSISLTMRFDAVRKEHIQPLAAAASSNGAAEPADLQSYLQPERLVPLDDTIRRWARAIYNHVVATVKYDKSGKGWGNGDIYYACDARRGNCTDFHAIFIGYARAVGIPARFAIGFPLPADRGSGKIAGYHCWAEFYAKGIGWVPVAASEAAKNAARREYFFGEHDENRVELSTGRDVTLVPRQQGSSLNYFVYPYVELDGGKCMSVDTSYSYKDLPL